MSTEWMRRVGQADKAYEALREEIVRWELSPGTHLNELTLAARLGVSRTPLREAVQRLARENLARVVPGRGAFVTEVGLTDVVHLFQLREALETHAARLCARQPERSEFERLHERFATAAPLDQDRYYVLVAELDRAVDATLGNPHMVDALRAVRGQLRRLRQLARRDPERLARSAEEHAAICRAVADGDEEAAARETRGHVDAALRGVLSALPSRLGAGPRAMDGSSHDG
ncbi:GntR family transcriptional regulator [Actinosynnema sp. NPDC050436]|uniref:GntR family transcriptional regulator n=1 Tax=Actinosynnema sp. NPDC050436 TaxID=3155659 RepID=UPI0033EA196A